MASKTITETIIVDDLDGSPCARSIKFELLRLTYSVDLTEEHISDLKQALSIIRPILEVASVTQQAPRQETQREVQKDAAPGTEQNPVKLDASALLQLFSAKPTPVKEKAPALTSRDRYDLDLLAKLLDENPECRVERQSYNQLRKQFDYTTVGAWAVERGVVQADHVSQKKSLLGDVYVAYARAQAAIIQAAVTAKAETEAANKKARSKSRIYPKGLRDWARANGFKVSNGAVAQDVLDAFAAAHPAV